MVWGGDVERVGGCCVACAFEFECEVFGDMTHWDVVFLCDAVFEGLEGAAVADWGAQSFYAEQDGHDVGQECEGHEDWECDCGDCDGCDEDDKPCDACRDCVECGGFRGWVFRVYVKVW